MTSLGYLLYRRYQLDTIDYGSDIVEDNDDECPESVSPYGHMVTKYRLWARAQFGLLEDTKANRMVLSEAIRRQMREDNVRDADISRYFTTCVELALVPTRQDIRGRRIGANRTARARKMRYARPNPSFYEWLWGLAAAETA